MREGAELGSRGTLKFKVRLSDLQIYHLFQKRGTVDQHFRALNKKYDPDFPPASSDGER